jgi:hypothetical protein
MALETLKDTTSIDGYKVKRIDNRDENQLSCDFPISICDKENFICFKIQNGPIAENGLNGCQVDQMIHIAKTIIEGLNAKFPCRENSMIITKLDEALMWSNKRKQDRLDRNVEGYNKS